MSYYDAMQRYVDAAMGEDAFGERIIYIPQGVVEDQFELTVVIDEDDYQGTGQIRGEGQGPLSQDRGRSVVGAVRIELPTKRKLNNEWVPVVVKENGKDRVVINPGKTTERTIPVRRILGRDPTSITIHCSVTETSAPQINKGRYG